MKPAQNPTARRVQEILGPDFEVVEFETSTRSAAEAAAAIGCGIGQIATSLVFRTVDDDRPVLVIASGAHRVNEERVGAILGQPIARADAAFVRTHTGFGIGGVPPVGHASPLITVIDETLRQYDSIWVAAGTANAVFRLGFDDLVRLTGGTVAAVADT